MSIQSIKSEIYQQRAQVTILDLEGRCLESCDSLFNHTASSLSFFDEDYILMSAQEPIMQLTGDQNYNLQCINVESDGRQFIVDYTIRPTSYNGKKVLLWIIEDFTAQYSHIVNYQQERNNAEIKYQQEKLLTRNLKAAQAFKVRFFQDLSHEIRNPVNNMVGLADLISREKDETTRAEYLKSLQATANLLTVITDNLLDRSAVETNQLKMTITPFQIKGLANEVLDTFRYIEKNKRISFQVQIDDRIPDIIATDRVRLIQILNNLIGNAVKFTEQGHIKLAISLVDNVVADRVLFRVQDTGIGISEDKVSEVLQRFKQETTETGELYGGLGLGLNISQKLVELLGGELSLTSTKNQGTEFFFDIPYSRPATFATENSIQKPVIPKSSRILIADDDTISVMILKRILTAYGIAVDECHNGLEALELAQNNHYDLIIIDNEMPGKNGVEVVSDLRKSNQTVPVLLLSGLEVAVDEDHSPINYCLTKPLKKELLNTILMELFAVRA